jgi:hypothetical protein
MRALRRRGVRGAPVTPRRPAAPRGRAQNVAETSRVRIGWDGLEARTVLAQPVSLPGTHVPGDPTDFLVEDDANGTSTPPSGREREAPQRRRELDRSSRSSSRSSEDEREAVALRIRERASTARIDDRRRSDRGDGPGEPRDGRGLQHAPPRQRGEAAAGDRRRDGEVRRRSADVRDLRGHRTSPSSGAAWKRAPGRSYSVAYKEQLERAKKGRASGR